MKKDLLNIWYLSSKMEKAPTEKRDILRGKKDIPRGKRDILRGKKDILRGNPFFVTQTGSGFPTFKKS